MPSRRSFRTRRFRHNPTRTRDRRVLRRRRDITRFNRPELQSSIVRVSRASRDIANTGRRPIQLPHQPFVVGHSDRQQALDLSKKNHIRLAAENALFGSAVTGVANFAQKGLTWSFNAFKRKFEGKRVKAPSWTAFF